MIDLINETGNEIDKFYEENVKVILEEIYNNEVLSDYTPTNVLTSILDSMLNTMDDEDNESVDEFIEIITNSILSNKDVTDKLRSKMSYHELGLALLTMSTTFLNMYEFSNKIMIKKIFDENFKKGLLDEIEKLLSEDDKEEELNIIEQFNAGLCSAYNLIEELLKGNTTIDEIISEVDNDKKGILLEEAKHMLKETEVDIAKILNLLKN